MIIIPLKSCPAKDFELKIELDAPTSLQQNAMRVSNNNLAPEQHRFFQFLIITSPHSAVRWTATAVNHNFNHWAKITTCTFNFLWLCDNLWNVLYFQARVAGSQVNLEPDDRCVFDRNEILVTDLDSGRKQWARIYDNWKLWNEKQNCLWAVLSRESSTRQY